MTVEHVAYASPILLAAGFLSWRWCAWWREGRINKGRIRE